MFVRIFLGELAFLVGDSPKLPNTKYCLFVLGIHKVLHLCPCWDQKPFPAATGNSIRHQVTLHLDRTGTVRKTSSQR